MPSDHASGREANHQADQDSVATEIAEAGRRRREAAELDATAGASDEHAAELVNEQDLAAGVVLGDVTPEVEAWA